MVRGRFAHSISLVGPGRPRRSGAARAVVCPSSRLGPSSAFWPFRGGEVATRRFLPGRRGTEVEMDENGDEATLLTRGEVAARLRGDPKTVTRWANAAKLT